MLFFLTYWIWHYDEYEIIIDFRKKTWWESTYFFTEDVFECVQPHGMVVFTLGLLQKPVKTFIRTDQIRSHTVPQDVHLFQIQPCEGVK